MSLKEKFLRHGVLGLLIFTLPVLLTGCFKFTMDLEVSSDDKVSGTAVVALSKELAGFAEEAGDGDSTDVFAETEGVTASEFDDGNFVGQQYEFAGVPIEELDFQDDTGGLTITRDGDFLNVAGDLNFEDESEDSGGDDLGFGQAFFDSADLRVTIQFPGEVRETNGELDVETNTVTWVPKYGQANEITATVYAPKGLSEWVWWAAASIIGLGIVLSVGFLSLKRARASRARNSDKGLSVSEEDQRAFPRSDRAVFSFKVRTQIIGGDIFELRLFEDELIFGFFDIRGNATDEVERVPILSVENISVLEGRAGFGVRLVHDGKVTLLPAKPADARTLASLTTSLIGKVGNVSNFTKAENQPQDLGSATRTHETKDHDNSSTQLANDIREFNRLREEGLISETEFEELKRNRIAKG